MGATGAASAACALTMGIIKGVERPTVGGPIIGNSPNTVVLDIGANVDCKPSQLVTFAVLGSVYAKLTFNINNPRIGILNVGSEKGKGNKLIRDTYDLLKNTNLDFIGNIEPQDLFHNKAEVYNKNDLKVFKLIKYQKNKVVFFINTKNPIWSIFKKCKFDCIVLESDKDREQMDGILKQNNYLDIFPLDTPKYLLYN